MGKVKRKRKKNSIRLPSIVDALLDDAEDWCRGRIWWPRLLLMLLGVQILVSHLKDPLYSNLFKGINLGFHEMGHMVFAPFGEFMGVAGGSIFQCLVPLLSTIMFFRQRDYFGIAFCFFWLSTNLFDLAVYVDDSRKLALPLVTPFKGDETIHDWNYLLDKLDMLQYDYIIANFMRQTAVFSMLLFLGAGAWLIFHMLKSGKTAALPAESE
ncbi:MAG: hypothetical protein K2X27_11960 [Candidatus Obscuribacterales bacterium]|nr:hypothetical protein [Candidatus Obscuribacterales bacterium]